MAATAASSVGSSSVPPSFHFPAGIQFPVDSRTARQLRLADLPCDARNQYNFTASGVLGSMQMAAGISSMVLMFASFALKAEHFRVGHGIWCGIVFLFAGFFGVVIAIKKSYNTRLILAFFVSSSVAAFFALILLSISCNGIQIARTSNIHRQDYVMSDVGERIIIHALFVIVGLLEIAMTAVCIYLCGRYLAGRYHSDISNPYGSLGDNVQYVASEETAAASSNGAVFFTIPSQLCPDSTYSAAT